MKKYILLLFLSILILLGCSLVSKYNLPNTAKINKNLLGVWVMPCLKYEQKEIDTLVIKEFNEYKYKLLFDTNEYLISYSLEIKNQEIMNIESKNGQQHMFYGFDIKNDTLRFYEVNKNILRDKIDSQEDLVTFFRKNIDKPDFFINACIMVREKI